jgi:dodecin
MFTQARVPFNKENQRCTDGSGAGRRAGVRCADQGTHCAAPSDVSLRARADRAPAPLEECAMSEHVYKIVEIVGSSASSTDDAIRRAVDTASGTLRHIDWFEVVETRGHVVDGKVAHFQVTLKLGFRIEP